MTLRRLCALVSGAAVVEVVLALLACAAGALVYNDFFATPGYLPSLVLTCLVGGVTVAVGSKRVWATLLLAAAGLAVVLVFGVFRGAGSEVLGGVRGSWNRLLAVAAPADPWGELLVVPALVMWAVAVTSVVLVLRTRSTLAPVVPPLAGFVFAVFVVGNQARVHATATIVFLLAVLVLIAVRAHRSTGDGTVSVERQSSRSVTALAAVALLIAGSAFLGVAGGLALPLTSGDHRFDPRDVLAPPVSSIDTLTPLAQLKSQLNQAPPRTLFTVRFDASSVLRTDRVRTAALDLYDGTTWTSADTYRMASSHLTVDPALTRAQPVTAHIDIKEHIGPYLPVIGWPSRLVADQDTPGRFGIDRGSGVVVSTTPNSEGLSYELTGQVRVRDDEVSEAAPAEVNTPPLPAGMPEPLRALAGQFTSSNPYTRLVELEENLRARPYQLQRPPGHSYAAITRMITDQANGGGYAEQYAAAFTVLARAWGLPARVAVGYRLRTIRNDVYDVSTADAHAWSEVHFAGYGWVVFDPSRPDNATQPNPPSEAPRVVPPHQAPSATELAAAPPASSQRPGGPDEPWFSRSDLVLGTRLLVPAAVMIAILATASVVIAKAWRRRRRRHAPSHAARVIGAWQEQLDRLAERGISPPVSLTFHEVGQYVRNKLGDKAHPIEASANLATTAVYAPENVDESESEQAWRLVAELRTGLYPRRTSAARLHAMVKPGPLWTSWRAARQRQQAQKDLEMGRYR